jgi:hypothetical protein
MQFHLYQAHGITAGNSFFGPCFREDCEKSGEARWSKEDANRDAGCNCDAVKMRIARSILSQDALLRESVAPVVPGNQG